MRSRRSPLSILDDVSLGQESLEEGFYISAIINKVESDDKANNLSPKIYLEPIKHHTDGDLAQINVYEIGAHPVTESDLIVVSGLGREKQNQEPLLIED